jgi:Clp amino terminal domain, pathogenicity island component
VPGDHLPTIDELADLVDERAAEPAPAARLRAAIALGRELSDLSDELIGRYVSEARAAGLSWTEIGQTFGTSKQAVQQRYGPTIDEPGRWPERWTPTANEALAQAVAEARRLGHDHVGTEHALLALASGKRGTAGEVLRATGVTPERMLATSCMHAGSGDHPPGSDLPLMPRLKQALDHARRIADGLGVRRADAEHLLAGILAVPDSMAVEILRRLGVSAPDIRAALAERLGVDARRLGAPRRRRRRLLAAAR